MSSLEDEDHLRDSIQKTAYIPAVMRAIDSVGPNRLVYDPASLMLIPPEVFDSFHAKAQDLHVRQTHIDFHAFRARAVEEVALTPQVLPQTVILGAGLDTLAWREGRLRDIYEIDQSDLFMEKAKKLPSTINQGKHVMIRADLASDTWARLLVDKGFNPMLPTVWIMEGLLCYCSKQTTEKLFQRIDELSVKDSRLFFDHWPSTFAKTGMDIAKILKNYVDNPVEEFAWFISKGWTMEKMIDFSEKGERYGRSHQPLVINGITLALYFVSASKMK